MRRSGESLRGNKIFKGSHDCGEIGEKEHTQAQRAGMLRKA